MGSVTARIGEVKQPHGGYLKPSLMTASVIDDGFVLHEEENIHATIIGLAVDYLTRFLDGVSTGREHSEVLMDAFRISLLGAKLADGLGRKDALKTAHQLFLGIQGLDDVSITNACKLATFDVWYRNPLGAVYAKTDKETQPDTDTIENIRVMVERSLLFLSEYGPVTKDGFTFEPNGYTETVSTGDGDFLTADTLWDFKVSKSKPTSKHTLQLLMYYIMGKHSGQEVFEPISKIGIFNPRLNTVYTYDVSNLSSDIIAEIEREVIGY